MCSPDELRGKVTAREWSDGMDYAGALAVRFAQAHGLQEDGDDLKAEALYGLAIALDRYDPKHKSQAKFTTYASWWITCRLHRYRKRRLREKRAGVLSLDEVILSEEGDDGRRVGDAPLGPAQPSPEARIIARHTLLQALQGIDAASREVLLLRHWYGYTLKEVGRMLGISGSAVHLREQRAKGHVREVLARSVR